MNATLKCCRRFREHPPHAWGVNNENRCPGIGHTVTLPSDKRLLLRDPWDCFEILADDERVLEWARMNDAKDYAEARGRISARGIELLNVAVTRRLREDGCAAVLFHGPGHQSKARCRRPEGHPGLHETVYGTMRLEAMWRGDEAITDAFDAPPDVEGY